MSWASSGEVAQRPTALDDYCAARGLRVPDGLRSVFQSWLPESLRGYLCLPSEDEADGQSPSMAWAELVIDASAWPLPPNLVPLLALDERSFACVVTSHLDGSPSTTEGAVVRWHLTLGEDRAEHQAAVLDTDCYLYSQSVEEEMAARQAGIDRMLGEIAPAYEVEYLDNDKRPRDFVLRPVRLACQNVIVGLAAFQHDSAIAGMAVPAWQTCELPHVATHEGNRAMAALMLCDAFKSGGTMEIRFDRPARLKVAGTTKRSGQPVDVDTTYSGHPEMRVPASLRRYGRTVGVALGQDQSLGDQHYAAISPREARDLFLAVTPMPADLRQRVLDAVELDVASPERLCFTLLAQVWREVELDFMLAVSPRTGSIITGGTDWRRRAERQAESEVTRAALMVGMLFRRLDATDQAVGRTMAEPDSQTTQADTGDVTARIVEDSRVGVQWQVLDHAAAVRFIGLPEIDLPWQRKEGDGSSWRLSAMDRLVVLPRTVITPEDLQIADILENEGDVVAFAVPQDYSPAARWYAPHAFLRCPDRLAELDRTVDNKLLTARTARA